MSVLQKSSSKTESSHFYASSNNPIWTQLQEIADNVSHIEESRSNSSHSSSATNESDSIGSARNPSPEFHMDKNRSSRINTLVNPSVNSSDAKFGRLSPMVLSRPSHNKLKQHLQNSHHLKMLPLDQGYHTLSTNQSQNSSLRENYRVTPTSSMGSGSSPSSDLWDVRATKTPISDLHILTHNAKHTPVSKSKIKSFSHHFVNNSPSPFDNLPDSAVLKIFSYLTSNQIVLCSRVSRRFYFLSWELDLWHSITLTGETTDADLALKTIFRLLSRNSGSKLPVSTLILGGCHQLTDRGLAMVARRCPQLERLEIQHCSNITNGGLMDLVTRCTALDHLDVTGCNMVSTISVHQPPAQPPSSTSSRSSMPPPHRGMMMANSSTMGLFRRQLNLQFLDLTDCVSVEDAGLKMIVESCPNILYLFLRRCINITDVGVKYIASYCLSLKELSISDCAQITDFGLYELAKLGPNLRYLSVAKCDQISDSGIKQVGKLCYKLRYLNVRGCEAVSDEALDTLARSCSRLRSLDLGKCDITDVGLKILSENCPNLKKLSVKSCEMVSDLGIQSVAYYCRGLQQLNIQDCPITVEGYRTVKKYCRRCIIEHTHPGFF